MHIIIAVQSRSAGVGQGEGGEWGGWLCWI